MDKQFVLQIMQDSILLAAKIGGPLIGTSLLLGVVVALFMAATKVNEASLSFVPKLVGIAVVALLMGSWMLDAMMAFTIQLFASIPKFVGV
ncbi:flagellar biosynthetic protein FliQ [Ferrimonas marina]|uniref:Flagellar biosynthetic protein FliQ n=1 Tax=Ferrimonas marina TaxID=299255 RepID=A0A1M5TFZ2_9GAMM|nr:flagellar biosynthetic protein FliQ [Ferrimonas marina]SHH49677.1 flagellar biosynthetic protein FliQ [Ferrimonas marina]